MATIAPSKIVPHLWFAEKAVEAASFYVSLFPGSRVDRVTPVPADTPSGPAGSVKVVEFTLAGQQFMAIEAGPLDPFNHAISFLVNCADQAEIDRLWDALSAGGNVEMCGWLRDRYGVSWQIVPAVLGELMKDRDPERARRAMEAMLQMRKLDIAALERAHAGRSTLVGRHLKAPRERVYRALVDASAVARWMVPTGMTSRVHAFEGREGGAFRISLTHDDPGRAGKSTARTDTYHGRFVKLVPGERVVEVVEFETPDPALRGEMTITITLAEANGGTELLAVHDRLPPGLSAADNEAGWRASLAKLAQLVEG